MISEFPPASILINSQDRLVAEATVIVEAEEIDVTPAMHVEPDMKWSKIDSRGHFHAFSKDEKDPLPTLEAEIIEHEGSCDCGCMSRHERIFRCRICGDVIEPQYNSRPSVWKETAPGPISWKIELSATRSGSVQLQNLHHERVSVRIESREGGPEYFGFGLFSITGYGSSSGELIPQLHGVIMGMGPLGSRDA